MAAKSAVTSHKDRATDSDATSSSASAKVDVRVDADSDNDGSVSHFDSAVSNNLFAMLIAQAQQDLALNTATARNLVANSGAMLTLGVQQINAATTVQMFRMTPLEAQALGLVFPETQTQT